MDSIPDDLKFMVTSDPKKLCMSGGLNTFSIRFYSEDNFDNYQISSCELVEKQSMQLSFYFHYN